MVVEKKTNFGSVFFDSKNRKFSASQLVRWANLQQQQQEEKKNI
jgi:hypothetical protein